MQTESIGQILIRNTNLTREQLDQALQIQQSRRPRCGVGQILIEKGFIREQELCRALARQWDFEYITKIAPEQIPHSLIRRFSLDYLKKNLILPITDKNQNTLIALADPLHVEAYDAVLNILDGYFPRVVCIASEIQKAISRCYYLETDAGLTDKSNGDINQKDDSDSKTGHKTHEDLLRIDDHAPIVKQVNTILFQAVNKRASDIHIEPYEDEVKVRFRIDGVLHDAFTPSHDQIDGLISRLKIMANLNIAERRLPQDGQSRIKIGDKEMDIRVSIIPTSGGERVVLRLLDKGGLGLSLKQLGFASDTMHTLNGLIHAPHGIILLTGPTGSGKTSTLYCAINELNKNERNILTVEDPIEYQLPGVGQMQVKPKINLNFANCLRHILRQDPDVIMIGEIRDIETAQIAIHASLTGHLVFSTLHTNDSASAVTRLIDMGIEPYLISSSLNAVMAQRLLRVICPKCKTACKTESNLESLIGNRPDNIITDDQWFVGSGCNHCAHTGYFGRSGIAEILVIDEDIKELIIKRSPAHVLKETAVTKGMRTLHEDGLLQARAGVTTLEEVLRVTQDNSILDTSINTNAQV